MLSRNPTLRLGRVVDATEIATLSRELIEQGLPWTWRPARVANNIRNRETATLVACDRRRIAAFAMMYFGERHAHLNLFAVRPEYRRHGLGRGMLAWLEESALTAGIADITLEVRVQNYIARRFYLALGYREVAHVPGYYCGIEAALRLRRDIRRDGDPLDGTSRSG